MIILQPNCKISRDLIAKDEVSLSQKIKSKGEVVIIPGEYEIILMDDTCEIIEIERDNKIDAAKKVIEKISNEELYDLARKKGLISR